jgi:cytochrome c oxidase subunit 3
VHAAHLLGGLVAWTRTKLRMVQSGSDLEPVRLSVELCSVYWHFLLLVWLVLFALLLKT